MPYRAGLRAALASACLACLAAACSPRSAGRENLSSQHAWLPGVGGGLASPLEMLRAAASGPVDSDRYRKADDYETALPSNLVSDGVPGPLNETLKYSPTWAPPGNAALGDAAYAVFRMSSMTGYSGLNLVQLGWDTPPADYGNLYIGVSDFTKNAWNWKQPGPDNTTSYTDLSRFFAPSGDMFIVVLLLGTAQAELHWVLAGDGLQVSAALTTDLNADPAQNFAPLPVNFDARASSVIGANIAGYDWDFDSDGNYEIEGDTSGQASHTYIDPGEYTATVHVVTDQNGAGTASLTFTAVNPANQAPVANLHADVSAGGAPLTVTLDASSSTDDGQIVRHEWDIDNNGEFDFDTGSTPTLQHIFAQRGSNPVTVRITDNDFATSSDSHSIVINSGWETVEVASGVEVYDELSMCFTGSVGVYRACLAFQDATPDDLFFARAGAEDGSSWGAPVEPVDNTAATGFGLAAGALPNGPPPWIAYGTYDGGSGDYSLHIVKAADVSGAAWNAPFTVDADHDVGLHNALAFSAQFPVLCSFDQGAYQGLCTPYYYAGQNSDGTLWLARVKIADPLPAGFYRGPALGLAAGSAPYLACAALGNSSSPLCIFAATDATGSVWNSPTQFDDPFAYGVSTALVSGAPTVVCGAESQDTSVHYVRALGTNANDWPAATIEISAPGDGGEPSLAVVATGPAVAWCNPERHCVMYATALDALGNSWFGPYEITPRDSANGPLKLVSVNGKAVICFADYQTSTVQCAWFHL